MRYRHLVVEVDGVSGDGFATITELRVFDPNNVDLPYSTTSTDICDSAAGGGANSYWNNGAAKWGRGNLRDGDYKYANNVQGSASSTVFLNSGAPTTAWARFMVDLGSQVDVYKVSLWLGSPEGRIPRSVKVYGTNNYDKNTHLNSRSNLNLEFIGEVVLDSSKIVVQRYDLFVTQVKHLVKDNDDIKTYGIIGYSPNLAVGGTPLSSPSQGLHGLRDNDPTLIFSGTFARKTVAGAYGGAWMEAKTAGFNIKFTTTAQDFYVMYCKGSDRGKVAVKVNGVDYGVIDGYNPSQLPGQNFPVNGLQAGTKEITLVIMSEKNPASSDTWFCFEGIKFSDMDVRTPSNSFEGSSFVYWDSFNGTNDQTNAWIGYDYGAGRSKVVRSVRLTQGDNNHSVSRVKVQKSDDNVTWTDVMTFPNLVAGINTLYLPPNTGARYWRVLADTNTNLAGCGWHVLELEMYSAEFGWKVLGTGQPTEDMFKNEGMDDAMLQSLDDPKWRLLNSGVPELLTWTSAGRYLRDITPRMSGVNTPAPFSVIESSYWSGDYRGWKAFNGTYNDYLDCWATQKGVYSGWLVVDLGNPVVVDKYTVRARNYSDVNLTAPKNWKLLGSMDGLSWTELHNVQNQTGWAVAEMREFTVPNPAAYRFYKLDVSASQGNEIVCISEIQFFRYEEEVMFVDTYAVPNAKLLTSTVDHNIAGVIDLLQFNATQSGNGVIKLIVSPDRGQNWYAYNGVAWETVDKNQMTVVKAKGMTPAQANAVPAEQWQALCAAGTVRFGYYLEVASSSDVAKLQSIILNEAFYVGSPVVSNMIVYYDEVDHRYCGLMFVESATGDYYSTNIGEILKLLDFGTIIAGQTSFEVRVYLANTLNFKVTNIRLWATNVAPDVNVELSYSGAPFIPETMLHYPNTVLDFDERLDFYVRVTTTRAALVGGNFDIYVKADPTT